MKILTGKQIREADRATIEREPIPSLELMERAATGIARWLAENVDARHRLLFCCGKGGNGGDGLAAARILALAGRECSVFLAAAPDELSENARKNLARLPQGVLLFDITAERPDIEPDAVIVDALLGVGVTGEVREPVRGIVEWINTLPNRVISIDIPSGMATEWGSAVPGFGDAKPTGDVSVATQPNAANHPVVRAETTLTIGFPKLAMLLPETGECAGNVIVIPIGLDENFLAAATTPYYYITQEWVDGLRNPRAKFSHKGDYGHALIVAGSATMPGAAILAVGGALRSGCGLVTAHVPKNERFALTANHPSAMLSLDDGDCFTTPPPPAALERLTAIGIGPGLGRDPKTIDALRKLLIITSLHGGDNRLTAQQTPAAQPRAIPLVLDADALNIIAENPDLQQHITPGSVLTPHPGELRRLVGEWRTEEEKLEKASELARKTRSTVIVKGAHSVVCTPDGRFLFNSTGTPGMAKGGSGDVLTGLITGLLARGYDAETASVTGVYLHGRAGERAARLHGEEAMNAGDLAAFL